jgi:hypothetical protein
MHLRIFMATIAAPPNLSDRVAETMRQSACLHQRATAAIVDAFIIVRRGLRARRSRHAGCLTHTVLPFARPQEALDRAS